MTGPNPSAAHVVGRLGALMMRLRAVVEARRADDPGLDDPFLGLYVSDEHASRLLDRTRPTPNSAESDALAAAADAEGDTAGSRLSRLRIDVGLDATDVDILVLAAAPDIDARFEQLYGLCNDDVTLRRATVGLAISLLGAHPGDTLVRDRFDPEAPLLASGLISFEGLDRPFLSRSLVVPDRVTAHLLGSDRIDAQLAPFVVEPMAMEGDRSERLAKVLSSGVELVHLLDPVGRAPEVTCAAAELLGRPLVAISVDRLSTTDDLRTLAAASAREARLRDGLLYVGPLDPLIDRERDAIQAVRWFAELDCPVVMSGTSSWDPSWARRVPLQIQLDRTVASGPSWAELAPSIPQHLADAVDGQFQLRPAEIQRAAEAAELLAMWDDAELDLRHVRGGARQQNGARLERLARRLEPTVGWDDLVLPDLQLTSLRRLADRARHRMTVLGEWGMRPGGGRGVGVMGLFAGDSGTGKTMSAEVLAGDLGLDLYVVNLATVVDKYVGETEKNLDRIFSDADTVNGVLLFDEADALFGSRSEVRDSHDRYANLEIAYLLQRMESFNGLALLSTNLRSNLDDAFARRLDATIEFPVPEPHLRLRLWRSILAPLTLSDDVDLEFCAESFELTGGNIRSAGISCGYSAAAADGVVTMEIVITAIADEYRKLGRLVLDSEFGTYHHLTRL